MQESARGKIKAKSPSRIASLTVNLAVLRSFAKGLTFSGFTGKSLLN